MNYKKKYLKYKLKYLKLKKLSGGAFLTQDDFADAERTDLDYGERCEKRKEIDLQIELIGNVIDSNCSNKDELIDNETSDQIDLHLAVLSSLDKHMDYNSFEYLKKTLSKIYNKEDIKAIIEEHFPETLSIPEHRPQQSNSVIPRSSTRPRSPTLDRMRSTVPENEPENQSTCKSVCNIM